MLTEVLFAAVLGTAAVMVCSFFESIWGSRSTIRTLPGSLTAPLSAYDKAMAERSRELIRECFCTDGKSVLDSIRQMESAERLQAARNFSGRLAQLNGLELRISFFADNDIRNCGGYEAGANVASFNIVELMWDGNDAQFEDRILNFLDTIVHEQRHAVQMRAIREKGFWQIEDARRALWATNLPPDHYISPAVDARAYRTQPIESDAFTYAALVLEGVT